MKTNVTNYDFHRAFESIRPDNFSYKGLNALYDWLIEYEESTDLETELDVIALCCELSEYDSREDCCEACGYDCGPDGLDDNTTVIEFDGGIIIQDF